MKMRNRVVSTLLLALGVATLVVFSPNHSKQTAATAVASSSEAPGTASMRAYLDPETGKVTVGVMTSSPEELDADTQNALRRDTEGLQVVRHADGSESMDLQGRYQSVSLVHVDENGVKTMCTDNLDKVENVIDGNVSHPNTLEVK